MPISDRDRERYPWIDALIRTHGGNYKQIEGISVNELEQLINRTKAAALALRQVVDGLEAAGEDCMMSVGVKRFRESLAGVERGAEIQNQCVRQYQSYLETESEAGRKPIKKQLRGRPKTNGA